MPQFDIHAYGPIVSELLSEKRLPALGPGSPNLTLKSKLQSMEADDLFDGQAISGRDMANCCLSALWLHHDFLDESHRISQGIHTTTGSYWHGIMHRREPDASNASYWFRKIGEHPIFSSLCAEASAIVEQHGVEPQTEFLVKQDRWNPFSFIQLCDSCDRSQSKTERVCQHIQLREWELLFDYCYLQSTR